MSITNTKDDVKTDGKVSAIEVLRQHLGSPVDQNSQTIRDNVHKALKNYFSHLDGQPVTDAYQMVFPEAAAPRAAQGPGGGSRLLGGPAVPRRPSHLDHDMGPQGAIDAEAR